MSMIIPKGYEQPEGLTPIGEAAWERVMQRLQRLAEIDCLSSGGGKVFYSPTEWEARGEQYGRNAHLIITYDGGDHRSQFNMDESYEEICLVAEHCQAEGKPVNKSPSYTCEAMQAHLRAVGLFYEECTGWFAAVYTDDEATLRAAFPGIDRPDCDEDEDPSEATTVEPTPIAVRAMDQIRNVLYPAGDPEKQWSPDDFDEIADIVRWYEKYK